MAKSSAVSSFLPLVAFSLIGLISVSTVHAAENAAAPAPAATPAPAAATSTAPAASGENVEVIKALITTAVTDREPAEEITTAKVGDVVVGWMQVKADSDVQITHRWLHGDEKVSDVPLTVKGGAPYRTWSRKTMSEAGGWKLQVLDPNDKVLKELTLNVTAADAAPAAAPAPATNQ